MHTYKIVFVTSELKEDLEVEADLLDRSDNHIILSAGKGYDFRTVAIVPADRVLCIVEQSSD